GIKASDWLGVYWARWGDALREAGFAPNHFQLAYDKTELLVKYAQLSQELGRLPSSGDARLKAHIDKTFPSHGTMHRLGTKSEMVKQLLVYCRSHTGYEDVVKLCEAYSPPKPEVSTDDHAATDVTIGFVYLVKSGRYFKIGRSNATGRRTYE